MICNVSLIVSYPWVDILFYLSLPYNNSIVWPIEMTLQLITSLLKVHIQHNCISCLGTLICCNDRILLLWKVQKTISIQKCCLYTYHHSRIGWQLYSIWLKAYYNFNRNAVKVRLIKEKVCYKAHNRLAL